MSDEERLIGISLAGFKVFEELTEIPLSNITLLYGPNSAGKSAVEDAIQLLSRMWGFDGDDYSDPEYRIDKLWSYWRRIDDKGPDLSIPLILSATFRVSAVTLVQCIQDCEPSHLQQRFRQSSDASTVHQLELRLTYYGVPRPSNKHESSEFVGRDMDVVLDGQLAISLREDSTCVIYLDHVFFSGLQKGYLQNVAMATQDLTNVPIFLKDGQWHVSAPLLRMTASHRLDIEPLLREAKATTSDVLEALIAFKDLFDAVVLACKMTAFMELRLKIAPASRKIPSKSELRCLIAAEGTSADAHDWRVNDVQRQFGILSEGAHFYRMLTHSLAHASVEARADSEWDGQVSNIGETVNRMLANHLFIERGYRLVAEVRLILSPSEYIEIAKGTGSEKGNIHKYPMLARLFLIDATGREFDFEEVGSGLGYVLPVLTVLFEDSDSIVIVQQPELHLHPALQSSLGDVFIEACHRASRPILLETHSEHLLLRILKRIRQTHQEWPLDPELRLLASDVSVLYFDPMANGVTRVIQLRVSEDGEFMDRWPKGFFAERDKELFDE
jgi:hypothetical protein